MNYADAISERDLYDGGVDYEPEPERSDEPEEDDMFSEVTHQECGGTVVFAQRKLDGELVACTVLVCQRCKGVITSTDDLHPQGAVCGVVFPEVKSQRRGVAA